MWAHVCVHGSAVYGSGRVNLYARGCLGVPGKSERTGPADTDRKCTNGSEMSPLGALVRESVPHRLVHVCHRHPAQLR